MLRESDPTSVPPTAAETHLFRDDRINSELSPRFYDRLEECLSIWSTGQTAEEAASEPDHHTAGAL